VLVVEYKGEHLFKEAEEKRAVGAVWEGRSGGKCLFVMPEGKDLAAITNKIKSGPQC
jgi:type III restriction enzyme